MSKEGLNVINMIGLVQSVLALGNSCLSWAFGKAIYPLHIDETYPLFFVWWCVICP